MRKISILGATGSIGTQTLDVVRKSKDKFKIEGISANSSTDKMLGIIKEFSPKYVAMMDENAGIELKRLCEENKLDVQIYFGMDGLIKIATLWKLLYFSSTF